MQKAAQYGNNVQHIHYSAELISPIKQLKLTVEYSQGIY